MTDEDDNDGSVQHPMQDLRWDGDVIRFRANEIIKDAVESGAINLNDIACKQYSQADHMQLAQMIGYSVSGFGDLSYAHPDVVYEADRRAAVLVLNRRKNPPAKDHHHDQ